MPLCFALLTVTYCNHRPIALLVPLGWWRSVVVSALASITVVNRHWARLVLGWATDCSWAGKPSGYNQPSRSTQPSTLCGMVKWVSAFELSNNDGNGGCSFIAAYRRACGSSASAWSRGRQPSGAVLHSSREPGELSRWLWVMTTAP